jgi:uroporphyrinogen-III synthase
MPGRFSRTVVVLSGPRTLVGIDRRLKRAAVRSVRIPSVEPEAVDPALWLGRLARAPVLDTVVVTSRAGVEAGVRAWRQAVGRLPASLEFWAVGPGTAAALRRAGIRRVRLPRSANALAVARSLGRSPSRSVVYFRSAAAGPGLARTLRERGHRVTDLVVYRLETLPPLRAPARRALSSADLLVVTSPSGVAELRRRLDPPAFSRLARTCPLVVLGERSRRAARRHGFRRISVAPATTAQRFTRHLLRELRHAGT